MTDDQLLRAVREIHLRELYIDTVQGVECYMLNENEVVGVVADMDAAAVAILREEMDKEPERPPLTETLRALYDICPEKFDDPTKSFVLTTEG